MLKSILICLFLVTAGVAQAAKPPPPQGPSLEDQKKFILERITTSFNCVVVNSYANDAYFQTYRDEYLKTYASMIERSYTAAIDASGAQPSFIFQVSVSNNNYAHVPKGSYSVAVTMDSEYMKVLSFEVSGTDQVQVFHGNALNPDPRMDTVNIFHDTCTLDKRPL